MGWRDRFKSVHLPEQVKKVKPAVSSDEQVTQVSLVLVGWMDEKKAECIDNAEPLPKTEPAEVNDNRLHYPERRALYARLNGLYLRLKRRLDKFERLTGEQETEAALGTWAWADAMEELYTGRVSWEEQRGLIYSWARRHVQTIRLHKLATNVKT